MFSGIAIAREARTRRWSALASFTFEAALVGSALAYPWFHPESLPPAERRLFLPLVRTARAQAEENRPAHGGSATLKALVVAGSSRGRAGGRRQGEEAVRAAAPDLGRMARDENGSRDVLKWMTASDTFPPLPTLAKARGSRVSQGVLEGNLISRVEPQYPAIAKELHVEGTVVVKAFISREGTIERAEVERGQALLGEAALRAVRQWRYRPYYLNHEPVEVETEITVNFRLER